MNTKNILFRILILPFMLCIFTIAVIILYFKWIRNYILFGGEIINYEEKNEYIRIRELYFMMKEKLNN